MLAIDDGEPVRRHPWPTYETGDTFIDETDEDVAVAAVRDRRYFRYDDRPFDTTHNGRLEHRVGQLLDTTHVLACTSGTTAIALSLLALDLPPNSAIACSAFTFSATPSAILLAGHRPVLIGIDEDLHLDTAHLREVLDRETLAAIVVVHMRGFASDMPEVMGIAAEFSLPVIEDAVPVLGATLHGRPLGTFGRFGAFSTQADKPVNTGEGGFLVTDDPEAYARAVVYCGGYEGRMARHFPDGPPPVSDRDYPHFAWRMDEIRAALATSMLDRLPERITRHRANYIRLARQLDAIPGLRLREPVAQDAYTGQFLTLRVLNSTGAESDWYAQALRAEGIAATALGSIQRPNARAFWNWAYLTGPIPGDARAQLPRTARLIDEIVDIPLSAHLTKDDLDDLVTAVRKVHGAFRGRTEQN
ncbi:DegT/DnrJ/EryC1/StrS family aminotransferase [Streptomyces cyaneofuscatus]|uniref:DegT/DnrJ/EryC1/StrS family aminotransferase n=1 Tax=Streptomyces cyaneofuscatus TaxID=66883 RepID=UPI00364A4CA7